MNIVTTIFNPMTNDNPISLDEYFYNYCEKQSNKDIEHLIDNLKQGTIRPSQLERLEVCFGADKRGNQIAKVLIYFVFAQVYNDSVDKEAVKHDGYFVRDAWTVEHRTHLTRALVEDAKKELVELGILLSSREGTYQAQYRYKINFEALRNFLNDTDEVYQSYLKSFDDHAKEHKELKIKTIRDNNRRRLRFDNEFWDRVNKAIYSKNTSLLQTYGLTETEVIILFSISTGMKTYQDKHISWNCFLYNYFTKLISGKTLQEAKDDSNRQESNLSVEDFRDWNSQHNYNAQMLVDACNPKYDTYASKYFTNWNDQVAARLKNLNKMDRRYRNDYLYTEEGIFNFLNK